MILRLAVYQFILLKQSTRSDTKNVQAKDKRIPQNYTPPVVTLYLHWLSIVSRQRQQKWKSVGDNIMDTDLWLAFFRE